MKKNSLECGAGFFRNGPLCTMCPGNEIKTMPGDAPDCSADPPCDGVTQEPNDQHTQCGLYFLSVFKTVTPRAVVLIPHLMVLLRNLIINTL